MRRGPVLHTVVAGIVVAACCVLAVAAQRAGGEIAARRASDDGPPPRYLSLGDSLAAGMQPDRGGRDRPTGEGYASIVGQRLSRVYPGLVTQRLSCGGATTGTLLRGGAHCQPDGQASQVVRAERILRAHPETVLVTVNIGDNDVEGCFDVDPPAVDEPCVRRGMAVLRRLLPVIARRLRAAAGPRTAVMGVLDYDQFLALWDAGPAGRQVARRSVEVIDAMNALMARTYRAAGVLVADAGPLFATDDLTVPADGSPPRAVRRVCAWTWACSTGPAAHDDHARAAGYRVIARAVLEALAASRSG